MYDFNRRVDLRDKPVLEIRLSGDKMTWFEI